MLSRLITAAMLTLSVGLFISGNRPIKPSPQIAAGLSQPMALFATHSTND